MITFYSDRYQKLELFPAIDGDGAVYVTLSDGIHVLRRRARNLDRIVFPLKKFTLYAVSMDAATPALAYLTDCEHLLDTGVRFLLPDGSLHHSPGSFQYHFAPPAGSLLAPCDLCLFDGYYHLFYTFAPFSSLPGVYYLGHAVSRDLLVWHHLPPVLEPPAEMRQARYTSGGILSCSAVMHTNGVTLYSSRSVVRRGSSQVLKEYIMGAESRDLLRFWEDESPALLPPSGFGPVFRNPKVARPYMVVGSSQNDKGAVLLYRHENGRPTFVRPLLREKSVPYIDMPDLFPVGKAFALLASFPQSEASTKALWYTGTFRNDHFRIRNRGIMDFYGDCSMPRAFSPEGKRLLSGVVSGAPGCLTLLREVYTRAGRLCMRPSAEVYRLQERILFDRSCAAVSLPLSTAAFILRLEFSAPTDFTLRFAESAFALHQADGRLIVRNGDVVRKTDVVTARHIELFADGAVLEVFINEGVSVGTIRLSAVPLSLQFEAKKEGRLQIISLAAPKPEAVLPDDKDAPVDTFDFVDYPFCIE